tara:strand:+ start:75116 stop:75289 length:174 start_codon:yes stop_codon:yes gene_type:complete
MKYFTIYYATGNKRRITSLQAYDETHAIDIVISNMPEGSFAQTRQSFTNFKAVPYKT